MRARRPYHECPECGSAAVTAPPRGVRAKLRCRRCGHSAWTFPPADHDPDAFDTRPRDGAGRVLPIRYDDGGAR